ncbi:hypothetical protein IFM89_008983 [Coptis chinensis]|uniref:Uncharacterized protein n=1 Tax=Coptis chinensis TaxID=261450 RepID=A0A835HUI1_9MAGN|nr:hypothetical protein IFM89_008983 [Coptis chinensis]
MWWAVSVVGKESDEEVQLFLGNARIAMHPLDHCELLLAGGNARRFDLSWQVQSFFTALIALSHKEVHYRFYATSDQHVVRKRWSGSRDPEQTASMEETDRHKRAGDDVEYASFANEGTDCS